MGVSAVKTLQRQKTKEVADTSPRNVCMDGVSFTGPRISSRFLLGRSRGDLQPLLHHRTAFRAKVATLQKNMPQKTSRHTLTPTRLASGIQSRDYSLRAHNIHWIFEHPVVSLIRMREEVQTMAPNLSRVSVFLASSPMPNPISQKTVP